MSSSSERGKAASYVPLEYQEASKHPLPFDDQQASAACGGPPSVPHVEEAAPDPEALFAARLEEQRHAITAQARQETEREIERTRAEIARAIEQFAQQRDEYFHQAEAEVVSLALAIARRIIHRETQIDPQLLAGLVNYELKQLERATGVRLLVSPETLGYWNEAAPKMSRPVEVAPDKALASGEVRIETVLGSTTVSFECELKEIERGFFDLLSHRPAAKETRTALVQ